MYPLLKYFVVLTVFSISVWLTFDEYRYEGLNLRTGKSAQVVQPPFHQTLPEPNRLLIEINSQLSPHSGGAPTTDDHGNGTSSSGHAGGHPSLFEALSAIHIEIGTYSVLIIIGFIILLKQIIEALSASTHDTPFHGMVKMIEEELMIVGTSSFIFKVVLNTTTFGQNLWAYPLEFGEVLVPLIAFSYCGIGIFMIMMSFQQCYTWGRAHNLKMMEILDEYYTASKTWYFR